VDDGGGGYQHPGEQPRPRSGDHATDDRRFKGIVRRLEVMHHVAHLYAQGVGNTGGEGQEDDVKIRAPLFAEET